MTGNTQRQELVNNIVLTLFHCLLLCFSAYFSAVYFTLTKTTTIRLRGLRESKKKREREGERESENGGPGLKHKSGVEGRVEGNECISRGSLVILIKNKLLMLRRDSCATVAGI